MICCCTTRPPVVTILVYTCTGVIHQATATCTGPDGANIAVSGSASPGQTNLMFDPTDGTGTYTVAISAPGHYPRTIAIDFAGASISAGPVYLVMTSIEVCVAALCSHVGAAGALVTVAGSISGTCTTASGDGGTCCSVPIADPGGDGLSPPGDYTITASLYRYQDVVQSFSFAGHTDACSVLLDLATPADCYQCCNPCQFPYNIDSMTLTTPWGGSFTVVTGQNNVVMASIPSDCSGTTTMISAQVRILYFCATSSGLFPSVELYFLHACKNYYGGASDDPNLPPSIGTQVVFDSVTCPTAAGGSFSASGSVTAGNDINAQGSGETIGQYFYGDYTLAENPCGSYGQPTPAMSSGPMMMGRAAPMMAARPRSKGLDRELVVAKYHEDVSWVKDSPVAVMIYDKGPDRPPTPLGPHVAYQPLPNRGREGRTWLEHIIRHWATLAEWTFFAQGEPHQDPSEYLGRLAIDYPDTTALTREYLPHFPSAAIKATDLIEHHGSFEVRYGRAIHQGGRQRTDNEGWLREVWPRFFSCPIPDPISEWTYAYGAMYAVPRARIKARPLAFWRWCHDVIARPEHQVEHSWGSGYAFELLWRYLFGDAELYPIRPPARTTADLGLLVDLCPSGSGPCGCGSGPPRLCSRHDRPDEVRRVDCLTCVAADNPITPE